MARLGNVLLFACVAAAAVTVCGAGLALPSKVRVDAARNGFYSTSPDVVPSLLSLGLMYAVTPGIMNNGASSDINICFNPGPVDPNLAKYVASSWCTLGIYTHLWAGDAAEDAARLKRPQRTTPPPDNIKPMHG